MKRYIPVKLLSLIENLISCCYSCVQSTSQGDKVRFRHRSCSPILWMTSVNCVFYLMAVISCLSADDILLISPSVSYLERLLHRCEHELTWLDTPIDFKNQIAYVLVLVVMSRVLLLLVQVVTNCHWYLRSDI